MTTSALAVLALVPVGLYVASYAPWFTQAERTRAGLAHCGTESPCQLGVLAGRMVQTVPFSHRGPERNTTNGAVMKPTEFTVELVRRVDES